MFKQPKRIARTIQGESRRLNTRPSEAKSPRPRLLGALDKSNHEEDSRTFVSQVWVRRWGWRRLAGKHFLLGKEDRLKEPRC